MSSLSIICLVLVGVLSSGTHAQNWGGQAAFPTNNAWTSNNNNAWNTNNAWSNNNGLNNAAGGIWGRNQMNLVRYYTCIGKNTLGDVMRITLRNGQPNNQLWWLRTLNRDPINIEVNIRIGSQSTTRGQYQLVLTEFGRVEDGCYTAPLGKIMTSPRQQPFNMWFRQQRRQQDTGVIGQSFYLAPNNGQHWSGSLDGFDDINNLIGRGMAVCRAGNIVNRQCQFIIPCCCKIGYDSSSATTPVARRGFTQMGAGITNVMNTGVMGGMNGGLNGGMNGGMTGGLNTGGMNTGGMTGGLNTGMNTGGMTGGLNTGGNPQPGPGLGGLTFQ